MLKCISVSVFLLIIRLSAGPIEDLKPGEWYEVPDSRLDAVRAPDSLFPWVHKVQGVACVMSCWAGGAFDTQRDWLLAGPGGGHNGYAGNEVYAFDLNTLQWHRLNDPDTLVPGTECTDSMNAPFALHSYDGLEYIPPPVDRYVVVGGWCTPRTYALDLDHPGRWEVYPGHGGYRTGDVSAYDPVSGLLWFASPSANLWQWDPSRHQWTDRLNWAMDWLDYYTTAALDYKRRVMVAVGSGKVYYWQILPVPGVMQTAKLATTGDTSIIGAPNPGVDYDPVSDKIVAWRTGADVYTLDLDSRVWTRVLPAATNTVTPTPPNGNGTYGRFRYVPSRNVFVLVNNTSENVFIYRLTAGTPSVITGVEAALARDTVETYIAVPAVTVAAVYADASRRIVTDRAFYYSLDPSVAAVSAGGVVTGIVAGNARIRAVYSDPDFRRGFSDTVTLAVKNIEGTVILDSLKTSYAKLTLAAGDSFQLYATGYFSRGPVDHFTRPLGFDAAWTSDGPAVAAVEAGWVKAISAGGPVNISASYGIEKDTAAVTVTDTVVITRINFECSDTPWKTGWYSDAGSGYSAGKGFGWLGPVSTCRNDRTNTDNYLLKGFVQASGGQFRVAVPDGDYVIRIAMGDPQYGGTAQGTWTSLGNDTLIYYEGRGNTIVTDTVKAQGGEGLVFTVNGCINYLVVVPVGVDINAYADDNYAPPSPAEDALALDGVKFLEIFPNPFNPSATLVVNLKNPDMRALSLKVYDLRGRIVADLVKQGGARLQNGGTVFTWNSGNRASGTYIVKLFAGNRILTRRMTLLK